MKKHSRVKAVVSLDAILHNFEEMRKNIGEHTQIIAVLKADGYGHGAVPIARMMEDKEYIWGFAVATAEEAFQLRRAGIQKPVLILGIVFEEDYPPLAREEIRIAVSSFREAQKYEEAGNAAKKNVHIHLALDTGMSRIGFADSAESISVIQKIAKLEHVQIEGMFTHFARADEYDRSPAMMQLNRYLTFAHRLREAGISIPICHCSNSAGIIRIPEANLNAVRAGITIYGIYPSQEVERDPVKLRPAMELKSHITFIKTIPAGTPVSYGGTFVAENPMQVATIPVGYADGYPRSLSNKGWVLIHGKKAPILGRVCMDQFMVDVTSIPTAAVGSEVTLMGTDGAEHLDVDTLGNLSGRFSYEFVCDITKRVPRTYLQNGQEQEITL